MVRFWQISLILGGLMMIGGLTVVAGGVNYVWGSGVTGNTQSEDQDAGIGLLVCSPFIFVIGIVFLLIGILGLLKRRRNREYAELLKANRRMKVADFARKIGKNEFKAEKVLMGILEDGQIKGFMDRRTEEFFTMEFLTQTPNVMYGWKCTSCGAKNDSVILPGEVGQCEFCHTSVGAKAEQRT